MAARPRLALTFAGHYSIVLTRLAYKALMRRMIVVAALVPMAASTFKIAAAANHEKHSVRIAIDPADANERLRRIAGRQRRREALA